MNVSEINEYIKRIISFDPILNSVFIEGEISNFKLHSSRHAYFTLKDEASKISCVMFSKNFLSLNFTPEDGMKVEISGNVSVYEKEGKYQLYVNTMNIIGEGELYKKFVLLKKELKEDGYFDKANSISKYPTSIGIITSPTGAAIRDILTVLKRRNPNVNVTIFPVNVQGKTSKFEVSGAIDYFNEKMNVDTIIISRGGGSLEELWTFNELHVAESIFDSKIPIISGVGHETDFTICDFVSDRRAATPSEAAEIAVADYLQIKKELNSIIDSIEKNILNQIEISKIRLEKYSKDQLYKSFKNLLMNKKRLLDKSKESLIKFIDTKIDYTQSTLKEYGIRLNSCSPLQTLERGYAIIEKNGLSINSIDNVENSDMIDIILKNGIIKTEVISKERTYIHEKK